MTTKQSTEETFSPVAAMIEFPTDADRDAEYARLDRLETLFAGREYELDLIDYRRGIIQSTDPRHPMSGMVAF